MKIPPPPKPDLSLPIESRISYVVGWEHGYRAGYRAGNPGSAKSQAKTTAARANGAKGGRPRKIAPAGQPG